ALHVGAARSRGSTVGTMAGPEIGMRHPHSANREMIVGRLAAWLFVVGAAASCGGPTDPSQNKTETFTGSVQPFGVGAVHPFNVPNLGEITVSVTAISPGNTFMGVGYGQPSGNFCSLIQQN